MRRFYRTTQMSAQYPVSAAQCPSVCHLDSVRVTLSLKIIGHTSRPQEEKHVRLIEKWK